MDDFTVRLGTVVASEPGRLVVRVEREESENCSGCHSCGVKSLCRGRDDGHMDLPVPVGDGGAFPVGARVRLSYRLPNPALAAAVMFVPPLIGLLLGGLVAVRWTDGGDAALVALCLAGLVGGGGATYLLSRLGGPLQPAVRLLGAAGEE